MHSHSSSKKTDWKHYTGAVAFGRSINSNWIPRCLLLSTSPSSGEISMSQNTIWKDLPKEGSKYGPILEFQVWKWLEHNSVQTPLIMQPFKMNGTMVISCRISIMACQCPHHPHGISLGHSKSLILVPDIPKSAQNWPNTRPQRIHPGALWQCSIVSPQGLSKSRDLAPCVYAASAQILLC